MTDTPIDEVRIGQGVIPITLDPLELRIDIGLSCGHGYQFRPIDGSMIFEVISLQTSQVTVVDIDQAADVTSAGVVDIDQAADVTSAGSGYIKGGPNIEPDAFVETGRGLQLVFLRPGVQHALQDPTYQRISEEQRGWWGMRTHDKMPEEGDQPKGKPGRLRNMIGLTNAGRQLASAWNASAAIADRVRRHRFEIGATHIKDGKVPPIEGLV